MRRLLKPAAFLACCAPLLKSAADGLLGRLGANPIERLLNRAGFWTLLLLMATLAATPLQRLLGWGWAVRLRRMLGLFAFFYGVLHFTIYLVLDQGLDWEAIGKDIAKRRFITVGFCALLLLVPLAITSTKGMVRRLGGARWRQLHRLIYLAALLGVIHFVWRVKADLRKPLIFAAVFALLMLARVPLWLGWRRHAQRGRGAAPSAPSAGSDRTATPGQAGRGSAAQRRGPSA